LTLRSVGALAAVRLRRLTRVAVLLAEAVVLPAAGLLVEAPGFAVFAAGFFATGFFFAAVVVVAVVAGAVVGAVVEAVPPVSIAGSLLPGPVRQIARTANRYKFLLSGIASRSSLRLARRRSSRPNPTPQL